MYRKLLAGFLSLSLLFGFADDAQAGGKSFSSGGKSSSFGSSSSGRSFSSGGSSSSSKGRSFSIGQPSSGKKSFSGGGQPTPKPSTPAPSDSGKKSFSSGGTNPAPNTTGPPSGTGKKSFSSGDNPAPSTPSTGKGKSFSSGGQPTGKGKSFSSGGQPTGKGKSFSSGGQPTGKGFSSGTAPGGPNTGERPKGQSIDQQGAQAQQKLQSKENFQKGQAPQQVYKDPKTGGEKKIDPKSPSVENIRNITHEKYVTRKYRTEVIYGPTYIGRPIVYYSDPYGSIFWWWLLDRSLEERAYWAYHHRYDMDQQRYHDLLAKDAQLEARIRQLESQGVRRDPGYTPAGLKDDPDLMYNKDYVNAVYNPTPVPVAHHSSHYDGPSAGTFFFWFFVIVLGIVAAWAIIWFIFIRETPD
jgi:hypothetical protein